MSLLSNGKLIGTLTQSQLKIIFWNNLTEQLEEFLPQRERTEYEQMIDLDYIRENSWNWSDYLSQKIEQNEVILLGEAHTLEMIEKNAVAEFLAQAKGKGITDIGLEIKEEHQEALDRFHETGKFSESDNPEDYQKIHEYQGLYCQFYTEKKDAEIARILMALRRLTKALHGNFLFDNLIYEYYPILKKAREFGLKIRCIDDNPDYSQEEYNLAAKSGIIDAWDREVAAKRDKGMAEKIKQIVGTKGRKMLVLAGSAHIGRGSSNHENLGDLLEDDCTIKSFRINLDRDLDSDYTIRDPLVHI